MKTHKFLFVLLICSLVTQLDCTADPSPVTKHWYTVQVTSGKDTEMFTGSSSLDAGGLAHWVAANNQPVQLDDIRSHFELDGKAGWHKDGHMATLFIVPRNVVYFYELAQEPKLVEQ